MSIHESSIIHPSSEIDDDVEIGPFCIIGEKVKIKSGSKLLSHVVLKGPTTVGKNNIFYQFCTIGEDTPDKKFKGEETTLEIGALTTIHQFCQMGDYSFAGMNASITMDVPSYIKVASNPARVVGLNSVGMERGGINQETITILKKAYKIIYRKGFNLKDAIEKVESIESSNVQEVRNFIDSIKSSERGILR